METRLITQADLDPYQALWLQSVVAFPNAFLPEPAEVAALPRERLSAMIDSGTLIGLFAPALVGFAGVRQSPLARVKHRATIGPFYVASDLHGSGAADVLIQACLDHARAKGAWMVDLYVAANNPRAIRFYERHGFTRYGRTPAAVVIDGTAHDDFYYCLKLPH